MPPDAAANTSFPAASIEAKRILVIAPHPDDESLGCGGLIASLSRLGRSFHAVIITDGGASHPNSPTWPRARLVAERERETAIALAQLGIGDQPRSFLRLPDSELWELSASVREQAIADLANIIRRFQPDLALLPWRRDPHSDHRDAWTLTQAAFIAANHMPETLEYTVWLEEFGEAADYPREDEAALVAFDIEEALNAKRAAVMAHVSQTTPLINDDPTAEFCLSAATIERLCGPVERYWKPVVHLKN